MKAAEKIRETGLPSHAVSDKTLRAILEEGPLEDDESMQNRWENLLANAFVGQEGIVRIAFPKILSELEPGEAALLNEFASRTSERSLAKKHSLENPEREATDPSWTTLFVWDFSATPAACPRPSAQSETKAPPSPARSSPG